MSRLPVMNTFPIGAVIREFRELNGMSRAQLERRSHVGSGYLTNVEENGQSPSLERVERISKALKIEMWELIRHAQLLKTKPYIYEAIQGSGERMEDKNRVEHAS